jgi:hypothetical protein
VWERKEVDILRQKGVCRKVVANVRGWLNFAIVVGGTSADAGSLRQVFDAGKTLDDWLTTGV